jgi:uncharacterized protein (TIGR02145 family)
VANKIIISIIILTIVPLIYADEIDEYVKLAWLPLNELLKVKGDELIKVAPDVKDMAKVIKKAKSGQPLSDEDYRIMITVSDVIGYWYPGYKRRGQVVYSNPLTYAIRISAMQNRFVYSISYIPEELINRDIMLRFCQPLTARVKLEPRYLEYVLHCGTFNREDSTVAKIVEKSLYKRAILGDEQAERELIEAAQKNGSFKAKIELMDDLRRVGSYKTLRQLIMMLDDTSEFESEYGSIMSVRHHVLRNLQMSFYSEKLFTEEYLEAVMWDSRRVNWPADKQGEARDKIKEYFQKVADWCKANYDYYPKLLIKYNYINQDPTGRVIFNSSMEDMPEKTRMAHAKAEEGRRVAYAKAEEERIKVYENVKTEQSVFTDTRDNKKYKAVKIGNKTWMAENLNYKTGDSRCYDNDESKCREFGRFYDWNTAINACPSGWRLPTSQDWKDLVNVAGGNNVAGKRLKSNTPGWNGTDDFKFSASLGGLRQTDGFFSNIDMDGYWWTATESGDNIRCRGISINSGLERMHEFWSTKNHGFSVRCVKDAPSKAIDK